MTREEADLIIAEQNKSKEEILNAVAKVKSDYHKLCKLKDMRIAELEALIEKMKCCGNCTHLYEGTYHNGYRCKDHARESVCDNWEIMTDEIRKEMLKDDL